MSMVALQCERGATGTTGAMRAEDSSTGHTRSGPREDSATRLIWKICGFMTCHEPADTVGLAKA